MNARVENRFAAVGLWGAILTAVVLAASALLRLSATIDAEGLVHSNLPDSLEAATRLAHRVSAMGVSVLALLALVLAYAARPWPISRAMAVGAIVALTIFLAIIGRYTPGYRFAIVTVGNVAGALVLACAFLWLRERSLAPGPCNQPRAAWLAALALFAVLAQAGLGAATSALAMHGSFAVDALHYSTGFMAAWLAVLAAAAQRDDRRARALTRTVIVLAVLQVLMGAGLAGAGATRPSAAVWFHAMGACAMATALVALAARAWRAR